MPLHLFYKYSVMVVISDSRYEDNKDIWRLLDIRGQGKRWQALPFVPGMVGHTASPALTRQTQGWWAPASLGLIERPYLKNKWARKYPLRKNTLSFSSFNLKTTNYRPFVHVTPLEFLHISKNDWLGVVVLCDLALWMLRPHCKTRLKPNKNKKV